MRKKRKFLTFGNMNLIYEYEYTLFLLCPYAYDGWNDSCKEEVKG